MQLNDVYFILNKDMFKFKFFFMFFYLDKVFVDVIDNYEMKILI